LNQLVEETYDKHIDLDKENKTLLEKVQNLNRELDYFKGEIVKKTNEIKDLYGKIERENEQNIKEKKNLEANFKEKLEFQKKDFKEEQERILEENERNNVKISEEIDKDRTDFEEKTLEFANSNKEMLKQLEKIFENEEDLREKIEAKKKMKEQTNLQEKSIRIALKELQEELMIGKSRGIVVKSNDNLRQSINKKNKTKFNE